MEVRKPSKWTINVFALFFGTALIISLNLATKSLATRGLYFSFGAFLFSYPEPLKLGALLLMLLIPFLGGGCLALLPLENKEKTAASAGFLAALILAWPNVIAWDALAPYELVERRNAFLLVYLFYIGGYAYLAASGCRLVSIYQSWYRARKKKAPGSLGSDLLDWNRTLKPLALGVVSSLLTLFLGRLFAE